MVVKGKFRAFARSIALNIRVRTVLAVAVALATAAMGVTQWSPAAAKALPAAVSRDGGSAVVISSFRTAFGRVLFTDRGRALYSFSGDAFPPSLPGAAGFECTALNTSGGIPCTTPWPALLATGQVVAGDGVSQAALGTVTRNGVDQVTYNGQPLYTFVGDMEPGRVNGANVTAFGGIFRLMSPHGRPAPGVARVDTVAPLPGMSPVGNVLSTPTAHGTERSLYELTADPAGGTTCVGPCTAIWPPLLTSRAPVAGPGVNPDLLGVIERPDGTLQVTYAGNALYIFTFDNGTGAPAGLTLGNNFADAPALGVWYSLSPNGADDPGTVAVTSEPGPSGSMVLAMVNGFPPPPAPPAAVTLYAFSPGSARADPGAGTCPQLWPPVLTTNPPAASSGVNGGLLGAIRLSDGTFQVTYDGHPLYFDSQNLSANSSTSGTPGCGGTFSPVATNGTILFGG